MITLTKRITKNERKSKPAFSEEFKKLIAKAYPGVEGKELDHYCKKFDEISNRPGMLQRVHDHLQGRAFGYWGETV